MFLQTILLQTTLPTGWQSHANLFAWAGLAMVVLGLSKTGFGGGGFGILSMPLLALAMSASDAVAVMGIVLVVVDLVANVHYIGQYEWRVLKWLLPGAVAGVGIGLWIYFGLQRLDPAAFGHALSLIIGILCLVVVLIQVWRLAGGKVVMLPTGPASSFGVGCVAGAASTIAHAAGPIVTLYVLQERVDKKRLVGTLLMYTLLINIVKLGAYVAVGIVTTTTLRQSLWLLPFLPIGTVAGAWMNKRLPERPFQIILYAAAAIASVQLLVSAFRH